MCKVLVKISSPLLVHATHFLIESDLDTAPSRLLLLENVDNDGNIESFGVGTGKSCAVTKDSQSE